MWRSEKGSRAFTFEFSIPKSESEEDSTSKRFVFQDGFMRTHYKWLRVIESLPKYTGKVVINGFHTNQLPEQNQIIITNSMQLWCMTLSFCWLNAWQRMMSFWRVNLIGKWSMTLYTTMGEIVGGIRWSNAIYVNKTKHFVPDISAVSSILSCCCRHNIETEVREAHQQKLRTDKQKAQTVSVIHASALPNFPAKKSCPCANDILDVITTLKPITFETMIH